MFYLKLRSVVVTTQRFVDDNRSDPGFVRETRQVLSPIGSLNQFDTLLAEPPLLSTLKNEVTYAAIDVFGRTTQVVEVVVIIEEARRQACYLVTTQIKLSSVVLIVVVL